MQYAICNICYDPPWHKKYVTIYHVHIFLIFIIFNTHRRAYRTSFSHINPTFFLLRHTHCLMDFYMLASCFLDPPRALHLIFDHDAAPILTYLDLHTLTYLFLYYFLFLISTFPYILSLHFFFTIIYISLQVYSFSMSYSTPCLSRYTMIPFTSVPVSSHFSIIGTFWMTSAPTTP